MMDRGQGKIEAGEEANVAAIAVKTGGNMERIGMYLLAGGNILLGFWIYYRGGGRFGLQTYQGYLAAERKRKERQKV